MIYLIAYLGMAVFCYGWLYALVYEGARLMNKSIDIAIARGLTIAGAFTWPVTIPSLLFSKAQHRWLGWRLW